MLIYTDWSVYIAVIKISHTNTRTNILTATLDLFAKSGYNATSVNAICKIAFLLCDWKKAYRRFKKCQQKNNLHFEQITR